MKNITKEHIDALWVSYEKARDKIYTDYVGCPVNKVELNKIVI